MKATVQTQNSEQVFGANLEFNRFGIIAILLLVVGCLGGIAVGLGAINSVVTLTAIVLPTMITLSMIIAVAPMRMTMISAIVASSIDVLMILYFALT